MQLLDRYIASVRSALPEAQRDDIVNELSENLRSQIEDRESELDRPLTDTEVKSILNQHGHPLVVAARYRQDNRSLSFGREIIGPALFPFYLRILKFNLGITTLIPAIIFIALYFTGESLTAGRIIPAFLYQFLIQFAIVTGIFGFADNHWKKHPDSWDPHVLKHVWHPALTLQKEPKYAPGGKNDPPRVSPFDSVAQIIGMVVGLAWLHVAQNAPFMIFGPGALFLRLAPAWHLFYMPVVALFLAGILQAAINVVRPSWVRLYLIYNILNDAAWTIIVSFLLRAGRWVVLADSAANSEGYRRTVEILNQAMVYGLAILLAAAMYNLFRHTRRLLRLPRPNGIPHPAA
jgi:hypothetical protein